VRATLRTRKTVAIICIALVAFAAFLPFVAASVGQAIFTPLWIVLPAVAITVIRRRASRCDEQPVSLLAVLLSRAPPACIAFV
jgi:hypothetical protein